MSNRLIFLVRHGATEANTRRPYVLQGRHSDLPLCASGLRQAASAARVLQPFRITQVVTSPLRRAADTARAIAEPHRLDPVPIDALCECDVGRWEGLSWAEVRQRDPDELAAFENDPGSVPYAGGESFEQVQRRAVPAIRRLIESPGGGHLVVVTHNVVARAYLAHVLGIPIRQARSIRQDNGGISVLSAEGGQEKIVTMNSVLHLEEFC